MDDSTLGINGNGFISTILDVSVGQFTEAIERLADMRAENGAEQNRVMNYDQSSPDQCNQSGSRSWPDYGCGYCTGIDPFCPPKCIGSSECINDGTGESVDQYRPYFTPVI